MENIRVPPGDDDGYRASSSTIKRIPPRGGSSTAPPMEKRMQFSQTNKNAGDVNNAKSVHYDYRTEVSPLANLAEACAALDAEGWEVFSCIGPMAVSAPQSVIMATGVGAVPVGCLILARKAKTIQ
jgi:hypothetical protein